METADMPTEEGSPLFVFWRGGRDSAAVAVLREIGSSFSSCRDQPVWALLRAALDDWQKAETAHSLVHGSRGAVCLAALLDEDGIILELARGPWRLARIADTGWLLLRAGEVRAR